MKPLVAIVGRPNVGKSTLFNRLAGKAQAIVQDIPGVTRDRNYADAELGERTITLIDTGGFVPGEKDALLAEVRAQAQLAVEECDVVLFVIDGRAGLTSGDHEVGTYLRKSGKPLILVANKLDTPQVEHRAPLGEVFALGLGDVSSVSAEHARGIDDLKERIFDLLPEAVPEEPIDEDALRPVRLAIIGRPNVGKSTLVNRLLKKQRVVASEIPGTTRDPIDSELIYQGETFILTDTAGIRRKKTIAQKVEQFSVIRALKTIEDSDVAVLLLDATEPAVDQDAKLAGIAEEKGRALIIVVNKWDKVPKDPKRQELLRDELKYQLKFVAYAPIIFTSALTGSKVEKVLELAKELGDQYRYRAATPQLNKLLKSVIENHPLPFQGGKPLKLYYIAQVATAPPTFALICNRPTAIPDRYKRYLLNQLREAFGLRVPIRIFLRERPGAEKREARLNLMKRGKPPQHKRHKRRD